MINHMYELTPALAKSLHEEFAERTKIGVTHCSDDPIENIKAVLDCACDDREIGDFEEEFLILCLTS